MNFEAVYFSVGALLVIVAVVGSFVRRLPLTATMIYLCAGAALGPLGFGILSLDAQGRSAMLERLAELAVLVSLFTTGLKLRVPLADRRWRIPVRLAFVSMTFTVGLVALTGVFGLGLPLGAAILLGAILAPTDPVLASDVQLSDPHDRDRLRFSLTGEAGLNDGTAFPFAMLGLGLLGLHDIGSWGWRWWLIDLLWSVAGGISIGALCGTLVGRLVLYLRRKHREGLGRDEFLALGLIGFCYGAALFVHASGFLAVFAAGLFLRRVEHSQTGEKPAAEIVAMETEGKREELATGAETAPAHMAAAVLGFNEQIERIAEVGLVLCIGALIAPQHFRFEEIWFIAVLFLVIRPFSVLAGLAGARIGANERGLAAWFGIRGIGSLYYLMFAVNRGLPGHLAIDLISITLTVIAISIVMHGITVTPLMTWYSNRRERRRKRLAF
ncbi:MAG: Na+/H+ antiporter [Chthoniobacteraceae bacterium]|nr:Na+/H+ antiporter [Chthoniobacteraceae bacterium]